MEPAIQKLEILFSQAEQELTLLETKVDTQFNILIDSSTNSAKVAAINSSTTVPKVIGNVNKLRAELEKVAEDVSALQLQQQQIMQLMQSELSSITGHLTSQSSVGPLVDLAPVECITAQQSE